MHGKDGTDDPLGDGDVESAARFAHGDVSRDPAGKLIHACRGGLYDPLSSGRIQYLEQRLPHWAYRNDEVGEREVGPWLVP